MTRFTLRTITIRFAPLAFVAVSVSAQPPAPRPSPRERVTIIDSVAVVDVAARHVTPMQRIVIRGDSIVAVQSVSATLPDTVDDRINARGAFAIPGLTD